MKALDCIIIEADCQYNNEVLLKNGTSIVVNTKIENVPNLNRTAKAVSVPKGLVIKEGDEILFHHNILRKINDHKGEVQQSDFFIKDNLFFVPLDMIFMYKKEGQDNWNALAPFCFVEPIKEEQPAISSNLFLPSVEVGHKGMKKNRGILRYGNDKIDIEEGEEVVFKDHREYEFEIDGKIYYKMDNDSILGTIVKEAV